MTLFIKRDTVCGNAGFIVSDELGRQKYAVTSEAGAGIRMTMYSCAEEIVSVIKYNRLMLNYFTISCCRRFYVLIPVAAEELSYAIYGSTYKFVRGSSAECFSILNAEGEIVMSHKRVWNGAGDYYELEIKDEAHELFLLSCAICADVYVSFGQTEVITA